MLYRTSLGTIATRKKRRRHYEDHCWEVTHGPSAIHLDSLNKLLFPEILFKTVHDTLWRSDYHGYGRRRRELDLPSVTIGKHAGLFVTLLSVNVILLLLRHLV